MPKKIFRYIFNEIIQNFPRTTDEKHKIPRWKQMIHERD
jgi:hypothetical protein